MTYLVTQEKPREAGKVTRAWDVLSVDDTLLGTVKWWTHWRRYVFFPEPERLFDAVCLHMISKFLEEQTLDQRQDQKRRREERKANALTTAT